MEEEIKEANGVRLGQSETFRGKQQLEMLDTSFTLKTDGQLGVAIWKEPEEAKCKCVGLLSGETYSKMHDIGRRVYDDNGLSPTLHTCGGGNLEAKVTVDDENGWVEFEGRKVKIRKLTPKEYFRLQGVKDEDFEKIAKNQSSSSLYHLAGDSITVDVLMAIFKQML